MKRSDPPITPETVSAYLESYGWLRRGRDVRPRERLAYRIIEFLADELAYKRVVAAAGQEKGKSWTQAVKK